MQRFIRWGLNNTVAIVILSVLVLAAGIYSTWGIPLESLPNMNSPVLGITISKMGYSADDIEQEIVSPMEDSLSQMKDITDYTSISNENTATIFITYPFEQDMDQAKTKLEGELDKLALPEGTKVTVDKISVEDTPVYEAAFSSSDSLDLQKIIEDKMIPELKKVDGVENVTLSGQKEQNWVINVNREKAKNYGITTQSIRDAIQEADYSLPVGKVQESEYTIPVHLTGKITKLNDLKQIEIASGQASMSSNAPMPNGINLDSGNSTVKLGDIATITSELTQNGITRFNGKNTLILNITKTDTANSPEVSNSIKKIISRYQKQEKFTLYPITDDGKEVTNAVNSLVREGLLGSLFTLLVIAVFLRNIRATIIAIVSLPLSIFASISLLSQLGYTLNIMTLGGLAVAVGRIVDDSIVVIENIFRWKQQKGNEYKPKQIVFYAAKEVLKAVTSSTLVTVVVFLPLAFVTGIIGQVFRPFALSVVFSILISLLVAFLLIPVLSSKFFQNIKHRENKSLLSDWYEKVLLGALKKKFVPVTLAILLLISAGLMVTQLDFSFLPTTPASTISVTITLPIQTKQTDADKMAQKVEGYIKGLKEIDYSEMSMDMPRSDVIGPTKTGVVNFNLQLKNDVAIDPATSKVKKSITKLVHADFPTGLVDVEQGQQKSAGNTVNFELYGEDPNALESASKQIEHILKQNNQLVNVTNNMEEVIPNWNLTLNDQGKKLHVDINQINGYVGDYLQGQNIDDFKIGNQKQSLTIAYSKKISSLTELKNIEVPTTSGNKKLGDIVTITNTTTPISIQHDQGRNYAQVSAVIKSIDVKKVTQEVQDKVNKLILPTGVTYATSGGFSEIQKGLQSLGIAILVAIGLVFLILNVTFGGIATPLIILSSILFVPIGSITGLLITGQSLSMSVMIGILMLIGIVVTNAVVLLDRIETNRQSGMMLTEAIVEAAKTRLRPILMTAFATIFALVPLALSASSSELISKGLAVTVIGGLTTSTLLTLIFVPVVYAMVRKKEKKREVI